MSSWYIFHKGALCTSKKKTIVDLSEAQFHIWAPEEPCKQFFVLWLVCILLELKHKWPMEQLITSGWWPQVLHFHVPLKERKNPFYSSSISAFMSLPGTSLFCRICLGSKKYLVTLLASVSDSVWQFWTDTREDLTANAKSCFSLYVLCRASAQIFTRNWI